MQTRYLTKATDLAKDIILKKIKKGDTVVDATVGNGYDTLFLANIVGDKGKVFGFDIQEVAIGNTRDRLKNNGVLNRVKLIKDNHANLHRYIDEEVSLVIFNLGYLPGGDHDIITQPKFTIAAIKESLKVLKINGVLLLIVYYGHEGGKKEKVLVEDFLTGINQKKFNVLKMNFINQANNPPILFVVEKNKL